MCNINRNAYEYNRNAHEYNIIISSVTVKINILEYTYYCRKFNLIKIPCDHAMAALKLKFRDDYGENIYEYTSTVYLVEHYFSAYFHSLCSSQEVERIITETLKEMKLMLPYYMPRLGRR